MMHIPATAYVSSPWKNGLGSTDEICLLPEGTNRDAFDLRVSRATIDRSAAFSSFPGVDRTITVIEGNGLRLDFGDGSIDLALWQGHTFDSGLTPTGVPVDGLVRVVNVMAAKHCWSTGQALVIARDDFIDCPQNGLHVFFALRGGTRLADGSAEASLAEGDCALVDRPVRVSLDKDAALLHVPLARVTDAR